MNKGLVLKRCLIFFFLLLAFPKWGYRFYAQSQFEIPLCSSVNESSEYQIVDKDVDTLAFAVSNPTIKFYIPKKQNKSRKVVLICPGGGYHTLLMSREGYRIAREFNKYGITAVVLKYRLPQIIGDVNIRSLAPIQDIQRAIKIIRDKGSKWGIQTKKLGVMGFSAGGHLASFSITHYNFPFIENKEKTNLKPDFAILINPIISMRDGIGHLGSRNNFMGVNPSFDKILFYSNEFFLDENTPPVFISHTKNDSVVPVSNSQIFSDILTSNNVKHKLVLYDKGDHGYLVEPKFEKWFMDCLDWLRKSNN